MLDRQREMLDNRLRKRSRHLGRWARRRGVTCYRLYDRDIPEVPLAIDWYDGDVVVSHFARQTQDDDWASSMADVVASALEVTPGHVHLRRRERQRGAAQYNRLSDVSARRIVCEGGHRFLVNFSAYLDTGLFLDHRETRALVAKECAGKRFLNLFCYTGSFSVYAARAGATSSVSVDMSNRYCDWARENLALNDVDPDKHKVIRGDVFAFLKEARRRGRTYQLAVVDPPTFSNSKRMVQEMDLQRDHVTLLDDVARVMAPGGVVFFSTNRRRFRLSNGALSRNYDDITDMSAQTLPEDYRGQPHRVWRLSRVYEK